MPEPIKPSHKSIKTYYETLAALGKQKVKHETGLRGAFQHLLTETAKNSRCLSGVGVPARRSSLLVRREGRAPARPFKVTNCDLGASIASPTCHCKERCCDEAISVFTRPCLRVDSTAPLVAHSLLPSPSTVSRSLHPRENRYKT